MSATTLQTDSANATTGLVPVTLELTEHELGALCLRAEATGRSLSYVVEEIVSEAVNRRQV